MCYFHSSREILQKINFGIDVLKYTLIKPLYYCDSHVYTYTNIIENDTVREDKRVSWDAICIFIFCEFNEPRSSEVILAVLI